MPIELSADPQQDQGHHRVFEAFSDNGCTGIFLDIVLLLWREERFF